MSAKEDRDRSTVEYKTAETERADAARPDKDKTGGHGPYGDRPRCGITRGLPEADRGLPEIASRPQRMKTMRDERLLERLVGAAAGFGLAILNIWVVLITLGATVPAFIFILWCTPAALWSWLGWKSLRS